MASDTVADAADPDYTTTTSSSKFRFKKRSHDEHTSHSTSKRHKPSRSHRRRYASPSQYPTSPSAYASPTDPNTTFQTDADPDTAFRESLFDALADDEGAAYWEGVYGQPIHTYPRPGTSTHSPGDGGAGGGRVEGDSGVQCMDDEEYASYVRGRMWEKTHQHVVEERERREEVRRREKARRTEREWVERDRGERGMFEERVRESLRKGEERKKAKRWREAWGSYVKGWRVLGERKAETDAARMIPWPLGTQSQKARDDVRKEDVEEFFDMAVEAAGMDRYVVLKAERFRWHPDKIQQRFGGQVDQQTMEAVTAVFQVVDKLWVDVKEQKSKA